MSENDNYHCAGTTEVAVKVTGMKERLKMIALRKKNRHRGCGRDMLRVGDRLFQVREASTGKEGPIADGGQPCIMTDIQRQ